MIVKCFIIGANLSEYENLVNNYQQHSAIENELFTSPKFPPAWQLSCITFLSAKPIYVVSFETSLLSLQVLRFQSVDQNKKIYN